MPTGWPTSTSGGCSASIAVTAAGEHDRRQAAAAVRRRRAPRRRPRGRVHEKPRLEHWINGGFFVFEPGALEYLSESSVLEREPLEGLAADGELRAFRHTGFWDCMDTYKDAIA